MSVEEAIQFQSSNSCWICEKIIDDGDERLRDYCHIPRKFRDAGSLQL